MPSESPCAKALAALAVALLAAFAFAAAAGAAPPPNDDLSRAGAIAGASGTVRGSNLEATKEAGEPNHARDPGGASIWYRWTAPADGRVMFTTRASTFDTTLAVYTGATMRDLIPVAASDDVGGIETSDVNFAVTRGVEYRIAVDGFRGKRGLVVLHWARPPPNDNIADARVITGRSGTMPATAREATLEDGEPLPATEGGGGSVWFRWVAPTAGSARFAALRTRSFAALTAYTGSTIGDLRPVQSSSGQEDESEVGPILRFRTQARAEYLIAVNAFNRRGGSFTLAWSLVQPPRNDDLAAGRRVRGIAGQLRGSNVGATSEPGERSGAATVWYSWRAPVTGRAVFTTAGSRFDTVLRAYRGASRRQLVPLGGNDDSVFGLDSLVMFRVTAGTEYRIAVGGFGGEEGRFLLHWGRVLTGTSGPDRLVGTRGSDVIRGGGGDDVVRPGRGPDVVDAGAGDDRVEARDGTRGNDFVYGGRGRDVCLADRRDRRIACP